MKLYVSISLVLAWLAISVAASPSTLRVVDYRHDPPSEWKMLYPHPNVNHRSSVVTAPPQLHTVVLKAQISSPAFPKYEQWLSKERLLSIVAPTNTKFETEAAALRAFYASASGNKWSNNTNYLASFFLAMHGSNRRNRETGRWMMTPLCGWA